jgi:hypothetical protein
MILPFKDNNKEESLTGRILYIQRSPHPKSQLHALMLNKNI